MGFWADDCCLCDGERPGRWWMPLPRPVNFQVLCDDCLDAEREMHGGRDPEGLRSYQARPMQREAQSITQRTLTLLAGIGTSTANEIAATVGADRISVRNVLRRNPELFAVVGTKQVDATRGGPRNVRVWAAKGLVR